MKSSGPGLVLGENFDLLPKFDFNFSGSIWVVHYFYFLLVQSSKIEIF